MKASLVIMAAGLGSRYGGEKQVDGIGPHGETIMEYSVYDAVRAGFSKVVFIVKPHMKDMVARLCAPRVAQLRTREGQPLEIRYVFQDYTSLPAFYIVPPEREKPFGTVHAALCAREAVEEPFALINADDYYGTDAFATIFAALEKLDAKGHACMVGYQLGHTVSEHGTVTRGVCVGEGGLLKTLRETYHIQKFPDGRIADMTEPEKPVPLAPETLVSMNFWGFAPWIFGEMEAYFHRFLRELAPEQLKTECLLPSLADGLIAGGKLRVDILRSDANWFGMTYQEDRPVVAAALRKLHEAGVYPA
jgi:UTP-glucose-1-phosphate uridylyltransferase